MILFYGPPPQIYGQNGMLRRIAHIDALFKEKERIYCYPFQYTERTTKQLPEIEKITEKVSFFPCDFQYPLHNELFVSLLKQSDFLYAHTVHSAQFLYPYYDSGKIITDLHGIAPEEEEMFGHANRARFYEAYERTLIQKSYRIIGVTHKMYQHYYEKYKLEQDRFVCLPIMPDITPIPRQENAEKNHIIYSGGIQVWQQVPKMLDAVKKLSPRYQFVFLSQQKNELSQLAKQEGISSLLEITSCSEDKLPEYYSWADYGFCLREHSPVNKVSCPTKLIEYAASGIIPIIDSDEIGDFFAMGGKAVTLKQLLQNPPPEKAYLDTIREANYTVIDRLRKDIIDAENILRQLPPPVSSLTESEWQFRFLDTESRTSIFPAVGQWQCGSLSKTEPDICTLSHQINLVLPDKKAETSYYIAPVPAILAPPVVYAVYENGNKKHIAYRHNFTRHNKYWIASAGKNRITISARSLQDFHSITIEINLLVAGKQVHAINSPLSRNLKHYANILFPVGTKRREYVKKLTTIRKLLRI